MENLTVVSADLSIRKGSGHGLRLSKEDQCYAVVKIGSIPTALLVAYIGPYMLVTEDTLGRRKGRFHSA